MNPGEQDELFEQLIRKAVRQCMENIEAPDAEIMWQRICERIEQCEREREAARQHRRAIFRRLTVAAAACLALGVGGLTVLRMGGNLLLTSDKEQSLMEASDVRTVEDYGFNDQVAGGKLEPTGESAEDERNIFLPSGYPPYAADEFLLVGSESRRAVEHVFTVEQFAHPDGRQLTRIFAPAEGLDRERFQAGLEEIIPSRLRVTGENEGVFWGEDPQGCWVLFGQKDDYWVCLYTRDAVLAEQLPSLYLLLDSGGP